MEIKSINLARLRQQQTYGFYGYIQTILKDVNNSLLAEIIAEFNIAYRNFDIVLKPIRKTDLTDKITKEDYKRDQLWRGLRLIVEGMILSPDPALAEIANRTNIILSTYGYAPSQAQTHQTGTIENLINDLMKFITQEERKLIGIEDWIKQLQEANESYKKLYLERVEYLQLLESGKTEETRKIIDDIFRTLVKRINAVYLLATPDEQDLLEDVIRRINVVIERENTIIKRRRSSENPDEPEIEDDMEKIDTKD